MNEQLVAPPTPPTEPTESAEPTQTAAVASPEKANRTWLWILLGVLGLAVVIGGIVLAFNLSKPKDTASTGTTTTAKTTTTATKSDTACLTADLVRKSVAGDYAPDPYTATGYQNGYSVFFESDSAVYSSEFAASQAAEDQTLAAWTKANADKKFHIELTAKVQEGTLSAAGAQLATDRANKVKQDLIDMGAPASKITVTEPEAVSGGDDSAAQAAYRNVKVSVIGDC